MNCQQVMLVHTEDQSTISGSLSHKAREARLVTFTPVGDYLVYRPLALSSHLVGEKCGFLYRVRSYS